MVESNYWQHRHQEVMTIISFITVFFFFKSPDQPLNFRAHIHKPMSDNTTTLPIFALYQME